MIVTYIRSSSFVAYDFCQQSYFLNYVCGYSYGVGKKGEQGTIVHKCLEIYAGIKKAIQDDFNATYYEDDKIGRIDFDRDKLTELYYLDSEEIDAINKSRRNQQVYKTECMLQEGHYRLGKEIVEHVFERVYEYYVNESNHHWQPQDKRNALNFTWMSLDYCDGLMDPRLQTVLEPELSFDMEIKKDWAWYSYEVDGETLEGYLRIKGTIDLVKYVSDDTIEVVDLKTGQRLDWAKGGEKTYSKLCKDPQLLIYAYALRRLYPDKHIIMTIFYIRDGGPFSIHIGDEQIALAEDMLRKRFEEIKKCEKPKLLDESQKHWKCQKLCPFYKHKFTNNDNLNMCLRAKRTIEEVGIEQATEEMLKPGHEIGHYEAPG